jgi:predicted nucleotidyltransferase
MSSTPLSASYEVGEFLSKNGIRYAVIGGLAVQFWGEPRLTVDVDIAIASNLESGSDELVRLITTHFESRTKEPFEFAKRARMILVSTRDGIDVDISLALPGYEDEMFARAIDLEIEPGKSIRICSAEDLIIHKAVAGRPQDISDIQGVVYRQGDRLEVDYIRPWLKEFAIALEDTVIQERFETAWWRFQESS